MTNIYFFSRAANTPTGYTRATRSGKYVRLASNTALHLADIGSLTHLHGLADWACNNGSQAGAADWTTGTALENHPHGAPSSPTITANNNNPPYYGLDLVYMDLAIWEAHERRLLTGLVVPSYNALAEDARFARFSLADGYYIAINTPGATGGTTTPQNHNVSGTVANGGSNSGGRDPSGGSNCDGWTSHNHTINLNSDSKYVEPANLVTRLYEAISDVLKVQAGIVAFVDGTPTSNWEILTGWANANLKAGNSNPTLSGSDTHTQSISGNTSNSTIGGYTGTTGGTWSAANHYHGVSAILAAAYHIPLSSYLIPVRLKYDLWRVRPAGRCVMC